MMAEDSMMMEQPRGYSEILSKTLAPLFKFSYSTFILINACDSANDGAELNSPRLKFATYANPNLP